MGTRHMTKLNLFLIIGLLGAGVLAYTALKPTKPAAPVDPIAAEALQMVRSHPARQAPTIEQAVTNAVKEMEQKGQPVRRGEWRVTPAGPNTYMVSVVVREKGFNQWIERDYAWRVNVKKKWIRVVTLPAIGIMPFHELPPLPHAREISLVPPVITEELILGSLPPGYALRNGEPSMTG